MSLTCEYCQSACAEDALKCQSCGASLSADRATAPDYRFCPFCQRRLLAMGSAACNYCGRNLPESYVRAREATLRRISEASSGSADADTLRELEEESDGPLRRALDSLFQLERKSNRKKSKRK